MAKQKIRLSENDLKIIMESSIRRILKEGSVDTSDLANWQNILEQVGAESMLDMIWDYMNSNDIRDFLNYAQHELGYENEDSSYEEDVQEPIDYNEGNL